MTTEEVKKKLKYRKNGRNWANFLKFMNGQTVGGTPNNPDWYERDVERFINGYKKIGEIKFKG